MIRTLLAGSGRVARARLRDVQARADATVVGVVCSSLERAADWAPGLPAFLDMESALEETVPDAVMVCGSNQTHAAYAAEALEAACHVSVDYPLALSWREAEMLASMAAARRRVLHVEHIDLLTGWMRAVDGVLPEVGEIERVTFQDLSGRQRTGDRDWVFQRSSGFSMFIHAAVLSRLVWIGGEVVEVSGREQIVGGDGDWFDRRITELDLTFAGGAEGRVEEAIGLESTTHDAILIVEGREGTIRAEGKKRVWLNDRVVEVPEVKGLFALDIDCFVQKIARTGKPYVSLDHAMAVMQAAELARQSIGYGE